MKRSKGRRGKGPSRQHKTRPAARPRGQRPQPTSYEFLGHPADVGFVAHGKSLADAFVAAAEAMCDCGWESKGVRARETIDIGVRAATVEDLLFSWLSELLFLSDAERWVFKSFSISRLNAPPKERAPAAPWSLEAQARGERFNARRHRARTYIKAVTYHQLAVKQKKQGWQATVYLDV
ncbi:MAG: archease [Terriglobia bacterium]